MEVVLLVLTGALVLTMTGIAAWGWRTLPPTAKVPMHKTNGKYDNWASKSAGLSVWPASGAGLFLLLVIFSVIPAKGLKPLAIALGIALVLALGALIFAQLGAVRTAVRLNQRQ